MPRRRPPTMAMRRALAALTVAVTHPGSPNAAAEQALSVIDWQRFELATGRMNVDVYVSLDMARGWLLRDGRRNVLIHPSCAAMVTGLSSPELAPWATGRGVVALDRLLIGPALRRLLVELQLPRG